MFDIAAHKINTATRAGRMLEGLLASENKGARVLLTTTVADAEGAHRLHQTFCLKTWQGRDGLMLSIKDGKTWGAQNVLHVDLLNCRLLNAKPREGEGAPGPLMRYAAEAALAYAWLGVLPEPTNGSVTVQEESVCGICGRELTDPVSIERGIGPDCSNKATGSKTIKGQQAKAS